MTDPALPPNDPQTPGGSGGRNVRAESGLTVIRDARLEARAIKWLGKQRYPVNVPKKQLIEEIRQRGDVTLPERLLLSVYAGLESSDLRRVGIAERNGIAIMAQVQADERGPEDKSVNVNVGVGVKSESPIQIYIPDNNRDAPKE
jgi:hypothetical protein